MLSLIRSLIYLISYIDCTHKKKKKNNNRKQRLTQPVKTGFFCVQQTHKDQDLFGKGLMTLIKKASYC